MLRKTSRLFFWGFNGTAVSPRLKSLLRRYPPAGVILFRRNIVHAKQLRQLTGALRAVVPNLLIGIDQEGGRVARLRSGFTQYPPASFWGELYQRAKWREEFFRSIGRFMGRELRTVGINLDFAPVLDVHSNPKNPIIGDRAFSSDPKVVIQTAIPFAKGLLEAGVIPCGKHFPGHGDTSTDSHKNLPQVSLPPKSLWKRELPPFQIAALAKIPALMTAHVLYQKLDPNYPATLSKIILQKLLRQQLGFKGVLFSDDLQMRGIADRWSLLESSLLAFEAGCDLLMICDGMEKELETLLPFSAEIGKSPLLKRRLHESLMRIQRLKGIVPN
ncbi:MAG: beta-N-acetylhexosaminidase [Deltaproteobacteria bacterium]|nr:beta-N-acetylhexosaminidase [Deltaproteobacteria bacterium]MBI2500663.1 beta-N-acetylhexosaminidase [Deltaproteobacteria bacterium]